MNRTVTFRLLVIALVLVAVIGLVLLADVRLAYSSTTSHNTSSSSHMGTLPQNSKMKLYVWIEEKDRLSTALRDDLMDGLRAGGRFEPLLLSTPKPTPQDFPILRVWIERPGYSWTPVYAQADMQVRWAFSSFNIEVSFDDQQPFVLKNTGGYASMSRGTVNLKDRTTGLVSLPGYWSHLAGQAAKAVQQEFVGQLDK